MTQRRHTRSSLIPWADRPPVVAHPLEKILFLHRNVQTASCFTHRTEGSGALDDSYLPLSRIRHRTQAGMVKMVREHLFNPT